jgi:hypothetical protein
MVEDLGYSPWVLPPLVWGLNATAEFNLGFAEPFCRLGWRFEALAAEAKDVEALTYAVAQLGSGVPDSSPYLSTIKRLRTEAFANPALLDCLIMAKQLQLAKQQADPRTALTIKMGEQWLADTMDGVHRRACHPGLGPLLKGAIASQHAELQALVYLKADSAWLKASPLFHQLASRSDGGLAQELAASDPWMRWAAATLIGRRRVAAANDLVQLLNDPVNEVREAAHQALVRLARGTDFGPQAFDVQGKIQQAVGHWTRWVELQTPRALGVGPTRPSRRQSTAEPKH